MGKAIPDRWIPYKACGNVIEGTRIVCFKVPLKKGVQENNKDIEEIWDITTLLQKLPNLGAVVDLTNTARYYNPKDLQTAGILHRKILMPGRIIPPEHKVVKFMNTVDELLRRDNDILIGVHCTHGLNRTGYMVCRYMRDRLGIAAGDAISRFEEARGYKIERENYVADLLGKTPPSPDVGQAETMIKPFPNRPERFQRPQAERYPRSQAERFPRPRVDTWYSQTQYRSPLNQYDETEHHQNQSRYRNRYSNYKGYNRSGDRQIHTRNPSSSGGSSRWDMSGMSHKPRS